MKAQFEVVWNGVNDGQDGDLLVRASAVPRKMVGCLPDQASTPREGPLQRDVKRRLRQLLAATPMLFRTRRELAAATRISEETLYTHLRTMHSDGLLEMRRRTRPATNDRGWTSEFEYRLSVAYRPIDLQRQVEHYERRLAEVLGHRVTL